MFTNLESLGLLSNAKTRSISAENPTGEKAGGAKVVPDSGNAGSALGKGWKIRPCITLPKKSVVTIAEIEGQGSITHIWITVAEIAYRNCILRMYWDGESEPSVEVPVGDFFCCGHGLRTKINSMPVSVNPSGGFNSYFPMPFRKSCKITIENCHKDDIGGFFYQFDYMLCDIPENMAYFHAQWRRSMTTREYPEHIILDGVQGQGHYAGVYLAWEQLSNGWWGEGELKCYIDGDGEYPTYCGTGTEDYFGGAWCFGDTYSTPFLGYPFWKKDGNEIPKHGLYRFHVLDPIRFERDIKVTIQALGWYPNGKYEPLTDDIASTVYWYQTHPHAKFPPFPPVEARFAR
ncbi:MAG: DUF2961 domain-containing protein [Oscillospiraceae bacterium]|nr:DUF2961 domain-containing protein [Oscillospiraceae bacterium]